MFNLSLYSSRQSLETFPILLHSRNELKSDLNLCEKTKVLVIQGREISSRIELHSG